MSSSNSHSCWCLCCSLFSCSVYTFFRFATFFIWGGGGCDGSVVGGLSLVMVLVGGLMVLMGGLMVLVGGLMAPVGGLMVLVGGLMVMVGSLIVMVDWFIVGLLMNGSLTGGYVGEWTKIRIIIGKL